jgi:hypothetical protein
MEEVVFFVVLAALVWCWPLVGAIVGLCFPGRRVVGALVGFVAGCLVTGAAHQLVPKMIGL